MLILVAHSGKTLELDVNTGTRVDAVQNAVATLCSLPPQDCIIICKGVRLDPSRTLSAYSLPPAEMTQSGGALHPRPDVFLYKRSWLRPDSQPPKPEALPSIQASEPPPADGPMCPHPLDEPELASAIRALPGHERNFKHHVAVALAIRGATQERLRVCERLLSEQEVQSMAIDAARANVELHYKYIHKAFHDFMSKYTALQQAQREVLLNFESDMAALAATELHPAAAMDGQRCLVDLVPATRLKEWAEHCRLSREQFAAKVAELEGIFRGLQGRVEGLLLKAPRTDLDEMGQQMERMDARHSEEAEITQRLQSDYAEVQCKVEEVVRHLAVTPAASLVPDAYCLDLNAIIETHEKKDLPKMRACDREVDNFLIRCAETKNEMTLEVREQLVQISEQQSRIRDMRNKLAVFQEVASKQGELFAELCLVGRIPAAYRACLAEVVRRRAFQELYAGQAAQLAERMAGLREREAARQEAFRNHVDPYITPELQGRLGLLLPPPLCEVNIPANPEGSLPEITMEEIQAAPREVRPSQLVTSVFNEWLPPASPKQPLPKPSAKEAPKPPGEAAEPSFEDLQLQNARLRADLAAFKAAAHLQQMKAQDSVTSAWATAVAGSQQLPGLADSSHQQQVPGAPGTTPGVLDEPPPAASHPLSASSSSVGNPRDSSSAGPCASSKREGELFAEALAAKDAFIQQLQAQVEIRDRSVATCFERIAALEAMQSSAALSASDMEGSCCTGADIGDLKGLGGDDTADNKGQGGSSEEDVPGKQAKMAVRDAPEKPDGGSLGGDSAPSADMEDGSLNPEEAEQDPGCKGPARQMELSGQLSSEDLPTVQAPQEPEAGSDGEAPGPPPADANAETCKFEGLSVSPEPGSQVQSMEMSGQMDQPAALLPDSGNSDPGGLPQDHQESQPEMIDDGVKDPAGSDDLEAASLVRDQDSETKQLPAHLGANAAILGQAAHVLAVESASLAFGSPVRSELPDEPTQGVPESSAREDLLRVHLLPQEPDGMADSCVTEFFDANEEERDDCDSEGPIDHPLA